MHFITTHRYKTIFCKKKKISPSAWGVNRMWNRKENEWKNGIHWKNLQHDTHIHLRSAYKYNMYLCTNNTFSYCLYI